MSTFIFMLTRNAGSAVVERVLTELSCRFPAHEFIAGDADIGGYENCILAMHGSTDEHGTLSLPDVNNVAEVSAAFRLLVKEIDGWKTS